MENASKALIVAGAILIAILLISVGMVVINSISNPIDQVSQAADSQAAQMFNSKFTNYAGKRMTADEFKSLIILVMTSNASDSAHQIGFRYATYDSETNKYIPHWYRDIEYPISDLMDLLKPNKKYAVEPLYTQKSINNFYYVKSKLFKGENNSALSLQGRKSEVGYISIFEVAEIK